MNGEIPKSFIEFDSYGSVAQDAVSSQEVKQTPREWSWDYPDEEIVSPSNSSEVLKDEWEGPLLINSTRPSSTPIESVLIRSNTPSSTHSLPALPTQSLSVASPTKENKDDFWNQWGEI